ncbi:MAG TPA: SDR family oxidoreductase [Stellaceae bacterium]|nr:SDR family oxidoreductase [Stellaceae bacterium]
MSTPLPAIAVLGASGLIGEAVASRLLQEGFPVVPIARRFNAAQKTAFAKGVVECPLVALDAAALARVLAAHDVEIVVNCIGVLQDGHRGSTDAVHRAFVERLIAALGSRAEPVLLIHLSIPGDSEDDPTSFSRTKRAAERMIAAASLPFVILRPGFVIAPAAYGGSALIRALAVLPFDLPAGEAQQALAITDVADIARTIAFIARRWRDGERHWNAVWDVMARQPSTVAEVVVAFRRGLGGPKRRLALPSTLMQPAARAGDLVAHLGWSPPLRSTALLEMRRGVAGDPAPWIAATGIEPASLAESVRLLPQTVQEKWFARLYLTKPLILASLSAFWALSGFIALTAAYGPATEILTSRGFSAGLAGAVTVASSLLDISVGLALAIRRTCRIGLLAGIGVSLFYMIAAAVLTPALWIEPLGALVKTGPAIVLMLVALAVLEDR